MTKQQEFRKQTEEAKFKAFSLMCKKVADLEKENARLKLKLEALEGQTPWRDIKDKSEIIGKLSNATALLKKMYSLYFDPCVTHKDLENRDKLFEEVKQFLRDTDIENAIQQANEGLNLDKIAEEVEEDLREGCPDVLCEECTKEDCTVRKLGLVPSKEIEK